ncbi:MAG: hypothetical protein V3V28_09375 [Polaribacter sp.]|uniref:hypothetical protein n=1 Tax=Polaribacter sp. TaxID=1920175 RepID=UPI002F3604FD
MENKFDIVFNRLKEIKLDENVLCKAFWLKVLRLHQNFNEADCWQLMTENISWLLKAKKHFGIDIDIITSDEIRDWFPEDILNEHHIYSKGKHHISNTQVIGLGDVKLEVDGHSEVFLFDNAFAKCGDTTFVKGYDNSFFIVTDCIGNAFENCQAESKGLSIVENWTNNKVVKGPNSLVVNRH